MKFRDCRPVTVLFGEFQPLFSEGAISVLPAMGLTFIAFQGYDLIATVTEEVEDPQRTIPRAILLSVVVTVIVYLLVVFVAIGTLGAEALGGAGEGDVGWVMTEIQASDSLEIAIQSGSVEVPYISFGASPNSL